MKLGLKRAMSSGQLPAGATEEMIEERLSHPVNFVDTRQLDRMVDVYHMSKLRKKSNI